MRRNYYLLFRPLSFDIQDMIRLHFHRSCIGFLNFLNIAMSHILIENLSIRLNFVRDTCQVDTAKYFFYFIDTLSSK